MNLQVTTLVEEFLNVVILVLGLVRDLADKERCQLEELADNTSLADSPEFLYLRGVRGLRQAEICQVSVLSLTDKQ